MHSKTLHPKRPETNLIELVCDHPTFGVYKFVQSSNNWSGRTYRAFVTVKVDLFCFSQGRRPIQICGVKTHRMPNGSSKFALFSANFANWRAKLQKWPTTLTYLKVFVKNVPGFASIEGTPSCKSGLHIVKCMRRPWFQPPAAGFRPTSEVSVRPRLPINVPILYFAAFYAKQAANRHTKNSLPVCAKWWQSGSSHRADTSGDATGRQKALSVFADDLI